MLQRLVAFVHKQELAILTESQLANTPQVQLRYVASLHRVLDSLDHLPQDVDNCLLCRVSHLCDKMVWDAIEDFRLEDVRGFDAIQGAVLEINRSLGDIPEDLVVNQVL